MIPLNGGGSGWHGDGRSTSGCREQGGRRGGRGVGQAGRGQGGGWGGRSLGGGRRFGCGFGRGGFNGRVNFEECSQLLTTPDGPLERRIARKR